jgi:hypothetical protein
MIPRQSRVSIIDPSTMRTSMNEEEKVYVILGLNDTLKFKNSGVKSYSIVRLN